MDKDSEEFKRVREELARALYYRDWDKNFTTMCYLNGDWDDEFDDDNTENSRNHYCKEAENYLETIKGLAILNDDQEPGYLGYSKYILQEDNYWRII